MADTAKETCFKDAMDAWEKANNKSLDAKWKQQWYRETVDGKQVWKQASTWQSFSHWIGSILKTGRISSGDQDPRDPGAANPEQFREPDLTMGDKAVDLKFTNGKGGIDPTGQKPGMGGGTQQSDYNQINGRSPNDPIVSLDKDSCHCEERGEPKPQEVIVPGVVAVPDGQAMRSGAQGLRGWWEGLTGGGAAEPVEPIGPIEGFPELVPAL